MEAYNRLKSVWKVADLFGMCGQSVHERLRHLTKENSTAYSDETKRKIEQFYKSGFSNRTLKSFCAESGLLMPNVSRWARERGLTRTSRKQHPETTAAMGKRVKKWLSENPHPKGMLGKKHSATTLEALSHASLNTWKKMTPLRKAIRNRKVSASLRNLGKLHHNRRGSWKAGWRTVGGRRIYFRSRWEANYGRYLEHLRINGMIKRWEHEPKAFAFTKESTYPHSYLPDFRVTGITGAVQFHEVKGWMDRRSRQQIARMKRYFPTVVLVVRRAKWFKRANVKMKGIIHDWE